MKALWMVAEVSVIGRFLKKKFMELMLAYQAKQKHGILDLESMHPNPFIRNYNESIYFACLGHDSVSVIARLSFRTGKYNENWLMVHMPGQGTWGFEDRELIQGRGFKQGTLQFQCVEPGSLWRIQYGGSVDKEDDEQDISLDIQWTASSPIADFSEIGTFPKRLAEQIASESWTLEFFHRLKNLSAVHYEQGGTITGKILFNGEQIDLHGVGIRDHSYGMRDWADFKRHFWCVGVLEDGRFFNFSIADYHFISDLKASFIVDGDSFITPFYSPGFADLNLGSDPLPMELEFYVTPEQDSEPILFKVHMDELFHFRMDRGKYLIREARSSCSYGDTKGICIVEMGVDPKSHENNSTH